MCLNSTWYNKYMENLTLLIDLKKDLELFLKK